MPRTPSISVVLAVTLLTCRLAIAQPSQVVSETGKDHFATQFAPTSHLKLDIRSGDVRISSIDSDQISVHFEGRKAMEFKDVRVEFRPSRDGGTLKITGGPRNEFAIRIEVPRETDLLVRMPFGELSLDEIRGDKHIELHAGELNIAMGNPNDYARIAVSVYSGEINSGALGLSKGGLFRSYEKDGLGKYTLYAHVGSGELNLK